MNFKVLILKKQIMGASITIVLFSVLSIHWLWVIDKDLALDE